MPNWKKLIYSGSDAVLNTVTASSFIGSHTGSLFGTASYTINASSASYVNTLNQNVLITGSLAIGLNFLGSNENTIAVGPPPAGGNGEGGQILLAASGGLYTSASMLDTYQDQFRILRGTNAGSDAFKLQINLNTGQLQLPNYNSLTAFTGTTVANLAVDGAGNVLTTTASISGYTGPINGVGTPPKNLFFTNGILTSVI